MQLIKQIIYELVLTSGRSKKKREVDLVFFFKWFYWNQRISIRSVCMTKKHHFQGHVTHTDLINFI